MKKRWSKEWKGSKQPRKQRKYSFNAPAHVSQKKMHAPLSKTLRKEVKKRCAGVRAGDDVKIMRGDFKGKTGKVDKIIKRKESVVINKISRQKQDSTKVNTLIHASKIMITKLSGDDSRRFKKK